MSGKGVKREASQMPEEGILAGFLSGQAFPQPWAPAVITIFGVPLDPDSIQL